MNNCKKRCNKIRLGRTKKLISPTLFKLTSNKGRQKIGRKKGGRKEEREGERILHLS